MNRLLAGTLSLASAARLTRDTRENEKRKQGGAIVFYSHSWMLSIAACGWLDDLRMWVAERTGKSVCSRR